MPDLWLIFCLLWMDDDQEECVTVCPDCFKDAQDCRCGGGEEPHHPSQGREPCSA